jgi:amylosucrase
MGTTCESRPEAHALLRLFNAITRLAAPSLLFKSEAIVHPDEVVQYIDPMECQLSYNPLQMALIWESLATRDAGMLAQALERRHNITNGCVWVNYVRSHDDIGCELNSVYTPDPGMTCTGTFADEDALELGKIGPDHRKFLNAFYVARHPGSFARGVPFQDNPKTGDCRISGTTASLAGLESGEPGAVERILLAHAITMSTGGIPLIYLGDEVGQLNDYSYMHNPDKWDDSRWVNRPPYPHDQYEKRSDSTTTAGQIFAGFRNLIKLRRNTEAFNGGRLVGFRTHNSAVLGYQRMGVATSVICLANFADDPQWVGREVFRFQHAVDLVSGNSIDLSAGIHLRSHQFVWLERSHRRESFTG